MDLIKGWHKFFKIYYYCLFKLSCVCKGKKKNLVATFVTLGKIKNNPLFWSLQEKDFWCGKFRNVFRGLRGVSFAQRFSAAQCTSPEWNIHAAPSLLFWGLVWAWDESRWPPRLPYLARRICSRSLGSWWDVLWNKRLEKVPRRYILDWKEAAIKISKDSIPRAVCFLPEPHNID